MNVDELVEKVREAIRSGVNPATGEQYEGCAFGPCRDSRARGGAGCHLCDEIARLPQPARLTRPLEAGENVAPDKAARDGDPKLSGAKARRHPMFEKRRRQGPHRGNA